MNAVDRGARLCRTVESGDPLHGQNADARGCGVSSLCGQGISRVFSQGPKGLALAPPTRPREALVRTSDQIDRAAQARRSFSA